MGQEVGYGIPISLHVRFDDQKLNFVAHPQHNLSQFDTSQRAVLSLNILLRIRIMKFGI